MSKITLTNLANLQNETTAVNAINANNATLTTALDNTLSRDGTSPNQMGATLDMNSNQIINLPQPFTNNSPLRLQDLVDFVGGGTVTNIPISGIKGAILTKASGTDFDVNWATSLYFDNTGDFIDRGAIVTLIRDLVPPTTGVYFTQYGITAGSGDNATVTGVGASYSVVADRAGVTGANKGALYGHAISIRPSVARNNTPFDDAACLVLSNDGIAKATDCIYVGTGSSVVGSQWVSGILIEAPVDIAFRGHGAFGYGLSFDSSSTFSGAAIRVPNATDVSARNAAGSADISMLKLNASNKILMGAGINITTGADTNILLDQLGVAPTFNAISLNGSVAPSTMVGFAGGATGITSLFYYVPTGGKHTFRYNNVDTFTIPTAVGTSGQALLSSGAGATASAFGTLGPAAGGTGFISYAVGDILYADTTSSLAKLNDIAPGNALISGGVNTVPSWGKIAISTHVSGLGTGVATALAVNIGSAGAFITFNGALGTPSSGTLTNCTSLPVLTGISGLGANIATFLATPTSANLATAVATSSTGSGALVFGTVPTITGTSGGTALTLATTASNNIIIGSYQPAATYNFLSLNNTNGTGNLGFFGGGSGDNNLYFNVPSTGITIFRVNNVTKAQYDTNGVFMNGGYVVVASDFNSTTNGTLSNVTGLTVTVTASKTYGFKAVLYTTSNVAAGVQAAIAGTATATAIIYEGQNQAANVIAGQTRASALATAVAATTAVTAARIDIDGVITVNAGGTLTVQLGQNVTNAAATVAKQGSWFKVWQIGGGV